MLRVGLTGGLGSGKSTAAQIFAACGAYILSADAIGRELMQRGQHVYAAIIAHFGPSVVAPDGSLNRAALARIAFAEGRAEELNAIVHPATIARQALLIQQIAARDPAAVVIVESALIFETRHGGPEGIHNRFDKIILVTAPDDLKIARFIARTSNAGSLTGKALAGLEADARQRLARQMPDEQKATHSDYILTNDSSLDNLAHQVDALWPLLKAAAVDHKDRE